MCVCVYFFGMLKMCSKYTQILWQYDIMSKQIWTVLYGAGIVQWNPSFKEHPNWEHKVGVLANFLSMKSKKQNKQKTAVTWSSYRGMKYIK